jgi:SAM-dependent methyltransferase
MTTAEEIRVSPNWLDLREPADAAARSRELVRRLRGRLLPVGGRLVVHDLACGSGSMGRWLAPLLAEPQHWILHDRDPDLLALAEARVPGAAAVKVEPRLSDVTRLDDNELEGASLVTASALLDLLTEDELARLVEACAGAECPALLALSVTGRVQLLPADPFDTQIAAAFDEHQRRLTPGGRLLGPTAVDAAAAMFRALGAEVVVKPSPWRLGTEERDLAAAWLTGWVDAACEQVPVLAPDAGLYLRRRLREAEAGALAVTVGHADLLVLP